MSDYIKREYALAALFRDGELLCNARAVYDAIESIPKEDVMPKGKGLSLNDYQKLAGRTNGNLSPWNMIRNGCYGLNSEAGECIDILKKCEFMGHPFQPERLLDEIGDSLWYVAHTATGLGVTLEDVGWHNIHKLEERYPDGFDPERSIHRKEYENGVH